MNRRDFVKAAPGLVGLLSGCVTQVRTLPPRTMPSNYVSYEELRTSYNGPSQNAALWLLSSKNLIERETSEANDYTLGAVTIEFYERILTGGRNVMMRVRNDFEDLTQTVVQVSLEEIPSMVDGIPEPGKFTVKSAYSHELGHVTTREIAAEMLLLGTVNSDYQAYFMKASPDYKLVERILVVFEGIANVFSNRTIGNHPAVDEWPTDILIFNSEDRYKYVQEIARPIMDQLGTKSGIAAMLSDAPPTEEEILEPALYHQRILDR